MFGLGVNGQSTGFGAQRINRRKRNNLPPSQPNQSSIIQTRSNSERSPAANIYQPDTGRPSLTSSEGSRRRARNALNRLKGPFKPSGPYQQYTPELERVLEENIKHLQGATRDLGPAVEDGSNEHPIRTSGEGRKRPRESEEEGAPGKQNSTSATAESESRRKRLKTATQIGHPAPLPCLSKLKPQPLQFQFPPHPDEDRSNSWYQNEFRKLFHRMDAFALHYFGLHDLESEGDFHQPWAAGMGSEFVSWVKLVAEPDPESGGWDALLRNTKQRQSLVIAILMRVIQVKILDADLWGADKHEKKLLLAIEHAFLKREGFQRTALRSQTVRTIMGAGPLTKNFHGATAKLTAQMALLLKPLTDFLYALPPAEDTTLPTLEDQYQALHNIIASAGYLSLCIRLSPTIFFLSEARPGQCYNPQDHERINKGAYSASEKVVTDKYASDKTAWMTEKTALAGDLEALNRRGNATTRERSEVEEKIKEHARTHPMPPSRTHRVLTQIALWPNIRRFKPGGLEDEKKSEKLENRKGFRIYDITKGAVVCYSGVQNYSRKVKSIPLERFVKEKEKEMEKKEKISETSRDAAFGSLTYAGIFAVPLAVAGYGLSCHFLPGCPLLGGGPTLDYVGDAAVSALSRFI